MYFMNCIRPDIAYSISKLSRFTSNPNMDNWKTIKRILKYLKYTLDYGLHYDYICFCVHKTFFEIFILFFCFKLTSFFFL
jgi:hypothetical protein